MPPEGGPRDVTPPGLVSISPSDSLLNTRVTRIELFFDEYITLNNAASEITVAPILPFPLNVEARSRRVIISIPDSLLQEGTTYRINFGEAIKDLNEGNPFKGYTYTFSTGSYFDTLVLGGTVINAATGLPDSTVLVMLYESGRSDSAVVREKPVYAVKTDAGGNFRFAGLPSRSFKIYALGDGNNNMIYDGSDERIAFNDQLVLPADSITTQVLLRTFVRTDTTDTTAPRGRGNRGLAGGKTRVAPAVAEEVEFSYQVKVDTSDLRGRTKDITEPIEITFTKPVDSFSLARVSLHYDSLDSAVVAPVWRVEDTSRRNVVLLNTNWKENSVYTLRLLKGFASDTGGTEVMPSRHSFRTKRDDDYAKLQVHLPTRYYGDQHIFMLLKGNDTIHHAPVTDTMVRFTRLQPGSYTMRVIADSNRNGYWDTGNLLERIQPEFVIPYREAINLRAGWENMIDFDDPARKSAADPASPLRRDTPR